MKKRVILLMTALMLILSACVLPEGSDPFERMPEEEKQTLEGVLYPFQISSVSTRVTHRLEDEGKLVSYLASDIVRLEDFEDRRVSVEGVYRTEKMREIFWVDTIRVLDIMNDEEEPEEVRLSRKKYSFVHPATWSSSESPDGALYFSHQDDPNRKVFFTFRVNDKDNKKSKTADINVFVQSLSGEKKVDTLANGLQQEDITLYSNLYNLEYRFTFTRKPDQRELKKEFTKLLNSFIEGETNVVKAIEEDLKRQAEEEAAKLEELKEEEATAECAGENCDEEESDEEENVSVEETEAVEENEDDSEEAISSEPEEKFAVESGEFEDMIDDKAFLYESVHYGFRMKVPYGYWFANLGQSADARATVVFRDAEGPTRENANYQLQILSLDTVDRSETVSEREEYTQGDKYVVLLPRTETTFFQISGDSTYQNAIISVANTVEKF